MNSMDNVWPNKTKQYYSNDFRLKFNEILIMYIPLKFKMQSNFKRQKEWNFPAENCRNKPVDLPIVGLLLMKKSSRICQHNQLWHYKRKCRHKSVRDKCNKIAGQRLPITKSAITLVANEKRVKIERIKRVKTYNLHGKCK